MDNKAINDLKWNYNYNLARYKKGCDYCEKHPNELEKWLTELLNILKKMQILLTEIMKYEKVSKIDILEGFKNESIRK